MDLYVYYRAQPDDALAIRTGVDDLQQQLRRACSVRCGLKLRPPPFEAGQQGKTREEQDTWMEIYLAVPVGFEETLAAAVAASPLQQLIDGDRHIEHFLDCLPCA